MWRDKETALLLIYQFVRVRNNYSARRISFVYTPRSRFRSKHLQAAEYIWVVTQPFDFPFPLMRLLLALAYLSIVVYNL